MRERMERFHFRLPHELRVRLSVEAARNGKQAAPYLRELLEMHLKKLDEKQK